MRDAGGPALSDHPDSSPSRHVECRMARSKRDWDSAPNPIGHRCARRAWSAMRAEANRGNGASPAARGAREQGMRGAACAEAASVSTACVRQRKPKPAGVIANAPGFVSDAREASQGNGAKSGGSRSLESKVRGAAGAGAAPVSTACVRHRRPKPAGVIANAPGFVSDVRRCEPRQRREVRRPGGARRVRSPESKGARCGPRRAAPVSAACLPPCVGHRQRKATARLAAAAPWPRRGGGFPP
jgi:hypothetical protein